MNGFLSPDRRIEAWIWIRGCVAFLSLLAACNQSARAQEAAAVPTSGDAGLVSSAISVPTAPEFFAALKKETRIRWKKLYRPPSPQPPADRSQLALKLGSLITGLHIAAGAGDAQQIRNIASDIKLYEAALGVENHSSARLLDIHALAGQKKWAEVDGAVEDVQNTLGVALEENLDGDLSVLIYTGAILRTMHAANLIVLESKEITDVSIAVGGTPLLDLKEAARSRLSRKAQKNPFVLQLLKTLDELHTIWSLPRKASGMTEENLKLLSRSVTLLEKQLNQFDQRNRPKPADTEPKD